MAKPPEVNMIGEETHQNQHNEQDSPLADMPPFEKHMAQMNSEKSEQHEKTYDEARREGTLPEGVRDEQDYQEYLAEQKAHEEEFLRKLKDSQEFVVEHYEADEFLGIYPEDLEAFIGSEDLKTIARYGFTLGWLEDKGIISKTDRWTNAGGKFGDGEYYWKNHRINEVFQDTKGIVADIAHICHYSDYPNEDNYAYYDYDDFATRLHEIISKYDNPDTLDEKDYNDFLDMCRHGVYGGVLYNRFLFGNPEDNEADRENIDKSVYKHTLKTLEIFRLSESIDVVDRSYVLCDAKDKLEQSDYFGDSTADHIESIEDALGAATAANMDSLIRAFDYPAVLESERHRELVKSCLTKNFILNNKNKLSQNAEGQEIFTDEELLGVIYRLDYNAPKKYCGAREIGYNLARRTGMLEQAGFSRKSIINALHDNKVGLRLEEIEDMRKAGVPDEDIAYAGRAYLWLYPHFGNKNHRWINKDMEKARFSEKDLLSAAIREIHENEYRNRQRHLSAIN